MWALKLLRPLITGKDHRQLLIKKSATFLIYRYAHLNKLSQTTSKINRFLTLGPHQVGSRGYTRLSVLRSKCRCHTKRRMGTRGLPIIRLVWHRLFSIWLCCIDYILEKSVSYRKKDGHGHGHPSFFWYDNDKDLKVCFLVTHVKCAWVHCYTWTILSSPIRIHISIRLFQLDNPESRLVIILLIYTQNSL